MTNSKNKTDEQLQKLTTKRLLAHYKAERKRHIRFKNNHTCECCGELDWELKCKNKNWIDSVNNDDSMKKRIQALGSLHFEKLIYLDTIKSLLNKREHVESFRIREGKEITNRKFVKTPKPIVKPAPQING